MGHTFREQAKKWLQQRMTRKRKARQASDGAWVEELPRKTSQPTHRGHYLTPRQQRDVEELGEKLSDAGLSPTTIRDVAKVMRWVKASAVDENGEQLYPIKWNYEFADIPESRTSTLPCSPGKRLPKLSPRPEKQERVIYVLFAASGLRAGELFGLEVKHFNGVTITVAQSVWEGRVQTPKTENAFRQVDLHPSVAAMLHDFIGDRNQGFISRLAQGHHFSNRTSFVALSTRFSKNSESRNRASMDFAASVSPTLNLVTCHPPS